jgi:thiamine kinase-like enzyme/predicted nucleotidyltransferase
MGYIETAERRPIEVRQEQFVQKTETNKELSLEVLAGYKEELQKSGLINSPDISEVSVLGSFGRLEGNKESDMDIWLVCPEKNIDTLDKLSNVSDQEFLVRQKVAEKLSLPQLLRHKASIFTEEEAEIYRKVFAVRVGIPYILGDFSIMTPNKPNPVMFDRLRFNVDYTVSLEEFIDHWQVAQDKNLPYSQQRKWTRRMVQEMFFKATGRRLIRNQDQEELIKNNYGDSDIKVIEATKSEIMCHKKLLTPEEIKKQQNLHKIMWTLEKVRWELIKGKSNPQHLENWRQGIDRSFGFYPFEIGQLITETLGLTYDPTSTTKKLGLQLIGLNRNTNQEDIDEFHSTLSKWISESARTLLNNEERKDEIRPTIVVPVKKDGEPIIRRIGVNRAQQLVNTEKEALKTVKPERLVDEIEGIKIKWIDTKDLGGQKLTAEEIEDRLPEYSERLNEFHQIPAEKFGRLGSQEKFDSYYEYLSSRLSKSSIPNDLKSEIVSYVDSEKDHLTEVKPVVCHMDSGLRNLIVDRDGKLQMIDFEHVSGCAKEWDIERVLLQLPDHLKEVFEKIYYAQQKPDQTTRMTTKIVMVSTFASNFPEHQKDLQQKYFDQVREWLKTSKN